MAEDGHQPPRPRQPASVRMRVSFLLHLGTRRHPPRRNPSRVGEICVPPSPCTLPTPIAVLSPTPWRRDGRVRREQQSAAARHPLAPRRRRLPPLPRPPAQLKKADTFNQSVMFSFAPLLLQSTIPRNWIFICKISSPYLEQSVQSISYF